MSYLLYLLSITLIICISYTIHELFITLITCYIKFLSIAVLGNENSEEREKLFERFKDLSFVFEIKFIESISTSA